MVLWYNTMNIPLFYLMRLSLHSLRTQVLLGMVLALFGVFLMPFSVANAEIPAFSPGTSSFPYASGPAANATPTGTFPYANQGLEAGLNAVESKLPQGIQKQRSFTQLVKDWINYFLGFYMFVTVGLILYYGFQILISRDKTEKRKEAMGAIINIILGTLLMVFAYAIIIAIVNLATPQDLKNGTVGVTGAAAPAASTSTLPAATTSTCKNEIKNTTANFYAYPNTKDVVILGWNVCLEPEYKVLDYFVAVSEDGVNWKGEQLTPTWVRDLSLTSQQIYFNGTKAVGLGNVPLNPSPTKPYHFVIEMSVESADGQTRIDNIKGPEVISTIPQ